MNLEIFRDFCLAKNWAGESMPFGNDTLVFKVYGKMFALCSLQEFVSANLKCDPEKAQLLRERYPDTVLPGYHMNKKHWNTVIVNKALNDSGFLELVDHSYQLVLSSIIKSKRL